MKHCLLVAGVGLVLMVGGKAALTGAEGDADKVSAPAAEADSSTSGRPADSKDAEQFFQSRIAPLLSRHCLECHGPGEQEGLLNLAKQETALEGGESGPGIVPGDVEESLVWVAVDLGDMPKDRAPLTPEEKTLLREWIERGAVWSGGDIDPLLHTYGSENQSIMLRRLTVDEYIETVRQATGVDIAQEARDLLPPDLRADGFTNTAYNLNIDLQHVEAYEELAAIIVSKLDVKKFARRFSKKRRLTDDSMRGLVKNMGKWLLRGPLNDREVAIYRGISTTVASVGGDFDEAVGYTIRAMLQSPRFIYRIEKQRGDGSSRRISPYELASRLSYSLWGGPPDKELFKAADDKKLRDSAQIAKQVDRMLQDPRAVRRSRQFIDQWLNLGHVKNLRPNGEMFPEWDPVLADDMRRETLAFFEDLVWKEQRPLADLLNAQFTYVTPRLAQHYGLPVPQADQPGDLVRVDVSEQPSRGGLLTHGSVLTIGGDNASMVTRGLFVLHDLFFSEVGDPPPGVDTTPIPAEPGASNRDISEVRIADRACGGCHKRFEPLAFGLERFDGLGTYREVDKYGNKLRQDGNILFPDATEPIAYQTPAEMMDLLAKSDRVSMNITRKLTQFALGRPLTAKDIPVIESVHETAQENGGTYQSVMRALVLSDLVRKTPTEQQAN